MASLIEVIDRFESSITDSVQDSLHEIERQFALTQTRYGHDIAVSALAMAFVISEKRREASAATPLVEE